IERGAGRIINIGSVTCVFGYAGIAPYCASRGGIPQLTMSLADDWGPHGVTVISVYPGLVRTESVMRAAAFLDLSNSESPQFIGRAVAALASDPDVMKRTGTVCVAAALGREYGFDDIDGKKPVPLSREDV
ncbi:MAG: SDR family NAD(P)-dependent oxidoreductase, partial [Geobacteraceae bacterium]|nr:SDR family NAD(P)-dependent oxidoreductase [Geobacteraceae bacterium]